MTRTLWLLLPLALCVSCGDKDDSVPTDTDADTDLDTDVDTDVDADACRNDLDPAQHPRIHAAAGLPSRWQLYET